MSNITHEELLTAKTKALKVFADLKKKYPGLRGHLEYYGIHSVAGQADLKDDEIEMIYKYQGMLASNCVLNETLLGEIKKLKRLKDESDAAHEARKTKLKAEVETIRTSVTSLINKAEFNPDVLIVIIFDELDYELIWKLQRDSLVSQNPEHTPQTKNSIRIALGSLETLIAQ